MECRAVLAVMVDKRTVAAGKMQEVLTKHGCIINLRVGLHETSRVCEEQGLILLSVVGSRKEVVALRADLGRIKGVQAKVMVL
jgi:hypothetical protein